MKAINASRFKAQCLAILDEVARTGERVAISKRGRVVAELVPARGMVRGRGYPQDSLRGKGKTLGDIVGPALPPDSWDAVRGRLK
jgi:prevent-host-death family protein